MKMETLLKVMKKQLTDDKEEIIKEHGEEQYNEWHEGMEDQVSELYKKISTMDVSNFDPERDKPPGLEKNKKLMKLINDLDNEIAADNFVDFFKKQGSRRSL
tara:strand:+ start:6209 stop:6514 length:306 start_codon:yes stop_codon:yes gene_type:complete